MKTASALLLALILTGCTSWEEEAQFRVATGPNQANTASVEQAMHRMQYRLAESLPVTDSGVKEKRRYTRSRYPKATVLWLADGHLFIQLWDAGERPFQTKSPYFQQAEEQMLRTLVETYGAGKVKKVEHAGAPHE
jgi:hypothetical protein